MNRHKFFQTVENELNELRIINKPHSEAFMDNLKKEHARMDEERRKKRIEELSTKIQKSKELKLDYATLINRILNNSLNSYELKFVLLDIELVNGPYDFIIANSYFEYLKEEDRQELFLLYKKQIIKSIFPRMWDFLDEIDMLKNIKINEDEIDEYIYHFKNMVISYVKGYILKNDFQAYLHEALPSALWLIEKSNPKTLLSLYLFEYPEAQTTEENKEEYYTILKEWYLKKGKAITCFEDLLNEKFEKYDYKNARRVLFRYDYLFELDFFAEKEQILMNQLYEQYLEYRKIEQTTEREHRINDIRNELLHFVDAGK